MDTSALQQLALAGEQAIFDMGQRYGVSADAVRSLLFAVSASGGLRAQFYHPELGGGGQWMPGGVTMVGDMFNSGLKYKVDGLCGDPSALLNSQAVLVPLPPQASQGGFFSQCGSDWWPAELGRPRFDRGAERLAVRVFSLPQREGLHVGHVERLHCDEIIARFKRTHGVNVLHPMGRDAFGLPAEQFAIKTGQHPRATPPASRHNFKRWGLSYDWSREERTTDPGFFQWTSLREGVRAAVRIQFLPD